MTMTGKVKWFSNLKGWGFIELPDSPDVFVHYTSITAEGYRRLRGGQWVEFEMKEGPRGPQAANVRVMKPNEKTGDEAQAA